MTLKPHLSHETILVLTLVAIFAAAVMIDSSLDNRPIAFERTDSAHVSQEQRTLPTTPTVVEGAGIPR